MKKYLLITILGLLASVNVHAESAFEICTEEAKESGIEEQSEIRAYVDECVEQLQAEGAGNQEMNEGEVPHEASAGGES